MSKLLEKIEALLGGGPGGRKRVTTFRWLMILGLVGVFLMLLNSYFHMGVKDVDSVGAESPGPEEEKEAKVFLSGEPKETEFDDIESKYEAKIKETLEQIVGVSNVDVLVTIDSTEEVVVERNRKDSESVTDEKDKSGATRQIRDVTRSGDVVLYEKAGDQSPIIIKIIKPRIRGVVVVAKGAENATVKRLIAEAVERGLQVPSHRISIIPRKQQ